MIINNRFIKYMATFDISGRNLEQCDWKILSTWMGRETDHDSRVV